MSTLAVSSLIGSLSFSEETSLFFGSSFLFPLFSAVRCQRGDLVAVGSCLALSLAWLSPHFSPSSAKRGRAFFVFPFLTLLSLGQNGRLQSAQWQNGQASYAGLYQQRVR